MIKVTVVANRSHRKSLEPNAAGPHVVFEVADKELE